MNWRSEAKRVLTTYQARCASLQSAELELQRLDQLRCTGKSGNDRLNAMVTRAELMHTCKENALCIRAVDTALAALSKQEQELLTRLFIEPYWGGVQAMVDATGIPRTTLYRRRDRALRKFTMAMYGR